MSLGPPFDDSGERIQLGLGAAAAAVLMFVSLFAVLAAERTLGDSILVHVNVARPGALHTGAPLRVAGEPIGEVVAIRGDSSRRPEAAPPDGAAPAPVDIEIRLLSKYRGRLFRNSTVVTVNPTLLTEAVLEVGPPAHGEAPGEPVSDGDRLRGLDPADIDQFMLKVYLSATSVLHEARDLRPDWDEFQAAASGVSQKLSSTLPADELLRLGFHATRAHLSGSSVMDKLKAAGAENVPEDVRALQKTTEPLLLELRRLAAATELLQGRTSALASELTPRQRELAHAFATLKAAAALGSQAETDVQALLAGVKAGRGTLGGFSTDIQIFDELKEMARILKQASYRVIIKAPEKGQRNVR